MKIGNPDVPPGCFFWGGRVHNGRMNSSLSLRSGPLHCELLPALGGSVAGFWYAGSAILQSAEETPQSAHTAASYPLVPYSNRIGQALLQWDGVDYPLRRNFAPEPHAIHGVGWERAWSVLSCGADCASLEYVHQGDAAWPFAFVARQTLRLTPDQCRLELSLRNLQTHAVPAGLGWHPYFAKSPDMSLHFGASGCWDMDAAKLPVQRNGHAGLDMACAALDLDNCFDGWDGALLLQSAARRIHLRSDLRHLVVYTTPQLERIALEPVSHVNNALALAAQRGVPPQALGLQRLAPGATLSARLSLDIEELS